MIAALILAAACLPTADAHARLADAYGEARIMAGLSDRGAILEIWIAPEGGTWTALITTPDGVSCQVDAGQVHTVAPPITPGDPA